MQELSQLELKQLKFVLFGDSAGPLIEQNFVQGLFQTSMQVVAPFIKLRVFERPKFNVDFKMEEETKVAEVHSLNFLGNIALMGIGAMFDRERRQRERNEYE